MKAIIIGGVAGGATAAARLRRLNESAEIIVLERGGYMSYANCGLPYYIGGEITDKSSLILQDPEGFRARYNVDVRVNSEAASIDPATRTVRVKNSLTGEEYTESYDKLILSPGARPLIPPIPGAELDRVFTLRDIPDTYRIRDYIDSAKPSRAVIIGGGFIGVEMAENLRGAGLDVTLIERSDHVIAPLDFDMACDVHRHVRANGVKLMLNTAVTAIETSPDGLSLQTPEGAVSAQMAIMAAGVAPDTSLAKNAGLEMSERGAIIVNGHMRTSDENIYAVGDAVLVREFVNGGPVYIPLAGPANKQGRIASDNLCGIKSVYNGTQGTSILRIFGLTAASTGLNERTLIYSGLKFEKTHTYSPSHASYYPGAGYMSVKLICGAEDGKLLGAQIVGEDSVDKRIDVLATAIRAGMTVFDLTELELAYAPPYSSAKDPVNIAGFVAENSLKGLTRVFHCSDVPELPRDGSVTLLDIRSRPEFARGHIDGFINIPVDELRSSLSGLDKSKTVYVVCQVGLRGHVACRILTQNGFDALNLSGGYRLYTSIYGK